MSGFDPSVLERKDRDELSQIAESLGQKPPSRARKADIVDLILRLGDLAELVAVLAFQDGRIEATHGESSISVARGMGVHRIGAQGATAADFSGERETPRSSTTVESDRSGGTSAV